MFQRLTDLSRRTITFTFEGREIEALEGDMVAAALLAAGVDRFHDAPVSGSARAPYCMMGACFECLVEIDGVGWRQACLTPVSAGMAVCPQPSHHAGPGEAGPYEAGPYEADHDEGKR